MTRLYSISIAVVVAAIPAYLFRVTLVGVPTNVFELLVAALIVVGLATPSIRHGWRLAEQQLPRPVIVLVSLFVLATLISASISDVPRVSFGIFKSWITVPLLLAWWVYAEYRIKNLEFRIKSSEGNLLYSIFSIHNSLVFSGTIVSLLSLTQFRWGERLSGIYDVPNSLALYLAPLIVVTVARIFPSPNLGEGRVRYWYVFAAALMFFALLLTQSVAGLGTVFIILIGALLFRLKTFPHFEMWKGFLVPLIAMGIVTIFSVFYLTNTGRLAYLSSPLTNHTPNSVSVRWQLWDISWELIKENPLLGVGLGQFEPAYQEKLHQRIKNQELGIKNFPPPLHEFVFRDPHNWILSFWLNTGLLGLLSFLGIHVYVIRRLWQFGKIEQAEIRNKKSENSRDQILVSSFYFLPLATLLLMGLVDTIYWKNDLSALHWTLLALSLRSPKVTLDGHQAKNSGS